MGDEPAGRLVTEPGPDLPVHLLVGRDVLDEPVRSFTPPLNSVTIVCNRYRSMYPMSPPVNPRRSYDCQRPPGAGPPEPPGRAPGGAPAVPRARVRGDDDGGGRRRRRRVGRDRLQGVRQQGRPGQGGLRHRPSWATTSRCRSWSGSSCSATSPSPTLVGSWRPTASTSPRPCPGPGRSSSSCGPPRPPTLRPPRSGHSSRPERLTGMTAFAHHLARRRPPASAASRPEAARDVLWVHNSVELWDLLVNERGWTADRYGRWVGEQLVAALL